MPSCKGKKHPDQRKEQSGKGRELPYRKKEHSGKGEGPYDHEKE